VEIRRGGGEDAREAQEPQKDRAPLASGSRRARGVEAEPVKITDHRRVQLDDTERV